jgi:MYXO-CTERM domain-containing protein
VAELLAGCGADAEARTGQVGGVGITRAATTGDRCGGAVLPECDGPFTGVTCGLPCIGDDPTACGVDVYCHSDGTVYGLATRNAVLFPGAASDGDEEIEAALEAWIVEHEAELGLEEGLGSEDLELHRRAEGESTAGPLRILRFAQTHRGFPVLAPDGVVTLVHGPEGAVSISGAIIDGRAIYDHETVQASAVMAELSIGRHASANEGVAVDELEVVHATRVAVPTARAIGWAGVVRRKSGGALARVVVGTDPWFVGPALPLLDYRPLAAAGLGNVQAVQVHTLDPAGAPDVPGYSDESTLTTGAPLLGSVDDVSQEIQLATERVVVLDLQGESREDVAVYGTRVLSPTGDFLAAGGAELAAQVGYHLFQSWYDFIDGRLTYPATGAKRWDSATHHYSNGGTTSDAPAGTFAPRVIGFVNTASAACPVDGTACATVEGYDPTDPAAMAFPELLHIPAGATNPEALGLMILPGDGIEPVTLAHEFGHIIDLFTGGGMTIDLAPACGGACMLECIEDTTDEAPPLTESIAQLLALAFLHQSFGVVEFDYCPTVDLVSVNGNKPWTPGSCVPSGEDISLFQRPGACAKPYPYCDKPEDPGTRRQCCFDDEDLTDCTIHVPEECEVGAVSPMGGVGTGTARAEPTGLCAKTPGYATNSLYQAFWQMLNGQLCEPAAPFACVSMEWAPGVAPLDAATDALLYAMRVNALTYEQLFDAMATYVSCTYGADAYDDFNVIACNHGIRDCAESPPLICQMCGNGVREGTEGCDGADWLLTRCDDLPLYSGGTLTCDQSTCVFDTTQCTMPGLDTTAGTALPADSSSGPAHQDTETTGAGGNTSSDDGCDCRTEPSNAAGLVALLSLLGARRRRRSA